MPLFINKDSLNLFQNNYTLMNIPYLLKRSSLLQRVPPSNSRPLFDVKYVTSASHELVPLFSLKRGAHLTNKI